MCLASSLRILFCFISVCAPYLVIIISRWSKLKCRSIGKSQIGSNHVIPRPCLCNLLPGCCGHKAVVLGAISCAPCSLQCSALLESTLPLALSFVGNSSKPSKISRLTARIVRQPKSMTRQLDRGASQRWQISPMSLEKMEQNGITSTHLWMAGIPLTLRKWLACSMGSKSSIKRFLTFKHPRS